MSRTYVKREVRSRPGLSKEAALQSLKEHPEFRSGTKIKAGSFQRRGTRWVATLLEPKEAEFPPKKDDDDDDELEEVIEDELGEDKPDSAPDSDDDDGDSDSGDSDSDSDDSHEDKGPLKPGDDLPGEGVEGEILSLLHKIVEALGLDKPEDAALLGAPDDAPPGPPGLGPKGPPPGGPPVGPPGPHASPGHPKTRPGPPGSAPAFSSFKSVEEMAAQIPTFTATTEEQLSIKQAKDDLEKTYDPYKVKQIRRKEGKIHALLSVR